jgi:hypothetical protein
MWFKQALLLVLLCVMIGSAQTKKEEPRLAQRGEPLYVLKVVSASLDLNGASSHACIIVYPNQSFRFEKRTRSTVGAVVRTTLVALDHLTDADAAQVTKIIHDADIAMLDESSSKRAAYPFKKELHSVYASIPRSNVRTQSIALVSPDDDPMSPAATSLLSFIQGVEARGLRNLPSLQPNDCQEPLSKKTLPN